MSERSESAQQGAEQQPGQRVEVSTQMPGQVLHRNEGAYCIHFTGMAWGQCAAGVSYKAVAVATPDDQVRAGAPRFLRPCLEWHHVGHACAQCEYPSAEEQARQEAESQRALTLLAEDLAQGRCVVCHQPMTGTYRLGRCDYAKPCQHRQGQM